ncbi:MAG: chromosomal replication initiator protein DnaA [bacterium]|nr:chromosomal replication initiator protein DnaA [bacterium]
MSRDKEKLQEIWREFLKETEKKVDPHIFENWIQPLDLESIKEDSAEISVPNQFFKSWIEANFLDLLKSGLKNLFAGEFTINFILQEKDIVPKTENQLKDEIISIKKAKKKEGSSDSFTPRVSLNPDFTFENFVVGPSNEFAKGIATLVSKTPGSSYNPLFIYGGVGLGKTHLMQAIGHEIQKQNPEFKVVYIPTENFMNEMIKSYIENNIIKFRKKYRNIDLLLMDDIHFLTEKEGLQEEFFHTFNSLKDLNKQIVLTSDRPPKKIPDLQERLVSRFSCGMVVDVQTPNLETRIAILKKKALKEDVSIPDDIINFIASRIKSNVRELEGALLKVIVYTTLNEKDLTLDVAKVILKDIIHQKESDEINIDIIQRTVAIYFDIRVADLKVKRRSKNIAVPRQIAMYLCRELTDSSLPEIGEFFGGRDHTTVLHAYNKILKLIESNDPIRYQIQNIINELKGQE